MQRTIFYKIFMSIIILENLVIFVSKILSFEDDKFIVYEISNFSYYLKLVVIYIY